MQVLVLTAPKNGVGRTTLVHRLARQALQNDAGPVVLLDADPRGDLTQICTEQPRQDIIAVPWDESCSGPKFQQLKARPGGLIIVDAALPDQPNTLQQVLLIADLVAVVVRPREDDVAQLSATVDVIEAADKPFFFLVNRAKRHGNMAAATAIALAQYGAVCPIVLPEDEPVAPSLRARVFRKKKKNEADLKRDQFWAYLSGRLEALGGEAAPAERAESLDGQRERRKFPRHSYDIGATFTWDRRVFPCRIQNISAGGLAMTADIAVPLGTRLKLQIPYLGEFDAISVHRDAMSAGLRFVIDEWQQAALVRDLTGLIAAGPAAKKAGGSNKSRQAREARGEESEGDRGGRRRATEDKAKGASARKRARS
jgi:chromosome partitioning protein